MEYRRWRFWFPAVALASFAQKLIGGWYDVIRLTQCFCLFDDIQKLEADDDSHSTSYDAACLLKYCTRLLLLKNGSENLHRPHYYFMILKEYRIRRKCFGNRTMPWEGDFCLIQSVEFYILSLLESTARQRNVCNVLYQNLSLLLVIFIITPCHDVTGYQKCFSGCLLLTHAICQPKSGQCSTPIFSLWYAAWQIRKVVCDLLASLLFMEKQNTFNLVVQYEHRATYVLCIFHKHLTCIKN